MQVTVLFLLLFHVNMVNISLATYLDYSSSKVDMQFSVGIIYDLHFMMEPFPDLSAKLHQVVHYVEENYRWKGTINFRFVPYQEFVLRKGTTALVSVLSCKDTWGLYRRAYDEGLLFIAVTGTTALVSVLSCKDTWGLYRRAYDEGLLFIAVTENDCPRLPESDAVAVPLTTEGEELSQLLLDLRTSSVVEWKSVAVITDHTVDPYIIESLVNSLTFEIFDNDFNTKSSSAMIYSIQAAQTDWERRNNVVEIMSLMPKLEDNANFLVVISFDLIGVVLDVIKQLNLLKPVCQWLIVLPHKPAHKNLHEFTAQLIEGANIAFLYNTSVYSSRCEYGLECHLTSLMLSLVEGLDTTSQAELEQSRKVSEEEWEQVKPSRENRKNTLLQFIKKQLRKEVKCDNCTMWSALAAELWGQDFTESPPTEHLLDIGSWTPRDGLTLTDSLFPHSKYGFRQLTLTISTFHFPPWQIIKYNSSGHAVEFRGVVFEIVDLISKKLNFTYNVVLPLNVSLNNLEASDGNSFVEGLQSKSESLVLNFVFEKIANLVKEKQIFLGACAMTVTESNANIVNFTEPVAIENYVFLVSRPKELSRALLFILPFTSDAWLCIISSIVLMAPTLYTVHRLSPFYEYHGTRTTSGLSKLVNCFWYVYGALLQQGGACLPTADSGRLVVGTWWIVVLVVVTTYCGNLVAFLTFPKLDKLVTNVDDLLERKDVLTWGMPDNSYIKTFLQTSEEPKLLEVFGRAQFHQGVSPGMMERVRSGHHAYLQSKTRLFYLMKSQFLATNTCDFTLGSEEILHEKLGMLMAQDNPYLELFNREIQQMHQTGLIRKWLMDYLPSKDRCWNTMYSVVVNNHTVNLDDMQGCFFVLFLGIVLSLAIIIVEILVKKHHLAREQRVIQPFVE